MNRPNPAQYVGYVFGRRLPDQLRDWVRNDLAGKGPSAGTCSATPYLRC